MKRFIAAASLVLAATPLLAAPPSTDGWSRISETIEQDYWIRDKDWMSGRPDSARVLVWTWVDHKRSRSVSHEMILLEINCPGEAYRFAQMQSFDHRGTSTSLGSTEWEFAPPETIIGEIVRMTCMEPQAEPTQERPQRDFW